MPWSQGLVSVSVEASLVETVVLVILRFHVERLGCDTNPWWETIVRVVLSIKLDAKKGPAHSLPYLVVAPSHWLPKHFRLRCYFSPGGEVK